MALAVRILQSQSLKNYDIFAWWQDFYLGTTRKDLSANLKRFHFYCWLSMQSIGQEVCGVREVQRDRRHLFLLILVGHLISFKNGLKRIIAYTVITEFWKKIEANAIYNAFFRFSQGWASVLSVLFRSFIKNVPFFSVLYKRTFHSFRSFPFFIKERSVLSVLFRSL